MALQLKGFIIVDNRQFYLNSIKQYGMGAKAVHWHSKKSQYKRFEVITEFLKDDLASSSVVDAGCGLAEYYAYLQDNKIPIGQYIGLDCEDFMIEHAQSRFENISFYTKDILRDDLPQADYYICSGALNLLSYHNFFKFIKNAFAHTKKGFVFNFLTHHSFNQMDIQSVENFCHTFNVKLHIKKNYLNNDITFFMQRQISQQYHNKAV
jgi:SAM-dependent methyltransferase